MRTWLIVIIAAAAASIIVAALLLYGGLAQQADPKLFLLAHLQRISVAWLTLYGIVALALTTGAQIIDRLYPIAQNPLQLYAARLVAVQYFTTLVALVGVGLAVTPIQSILSEPSAIQHSPALLACGGLAFAGLVSALVLAVAARTRSGARQRSEDPQVRLLNEVLDILRAEPRARTPGSELAQLAREIAEGQRSTLAVVKDLATAVNQLRRSLDEIKRAPRGVSTGPDDDEVSPAAEKAANDLRAATGAIDAAVQKLGELANAIYAREMTAEGDPGLPLGRARVSGELQALLREITPEAPAARRNPGE